MGGNTTNKDLEYRIEGLEKILENSQRDNYKIHQETQVVIAESEKKPLVGDGFYEFHDGETLQTSSVVGC